ncbi:MAG: family transporter [Chitinophagaceae bacterium]|nr:family transporter [Chitinophagaceae bacterium]
MNSPVPTSSRTFIETVLVLLLLLALMFALYDVLRVFFGVFTYALIFSVSFATPFERLVRILKNKRRLAAFLYSLLLITAIALPFIYIISAMSQQLNDAGQWIADVKENGLPPLPSWVAALPYIGNEISSFWQQMQDNPKEAVNLHEGQIKTLLHHIVTGGAGMLGAAFEFVTGIIVSAIFLVGGKKILQPVNAVMTHLLGPMDGPALLNATGQAIKGVAVGVMGTAFIAAIISWIGFFIAGIPFALALTALVFFLVLIQLGPLLVLVPLIIWLASQGQTGWTIFMVIYSVLLVAIDSILKPILIAKSGKLPFLILFLGVIGGLVAWGFTGMFKGAIILAVFYTIVNSWLEKTKQGDPASTE